MSLFGSTARSSNKNLVEFRAGKMNLKGTTVTADKRKGQVYVHQAEDSLVHFCWKDRTTGTIEDDLIIFPDDCELKRVPQCTTGRVYVLKFKSSNRKLFFWMQEPKTDKDDEHCKKVNDALNNPQAAGQPSVADLGGIDPMGQGMQDLFNNLDQQQLLQLMTAGGGMNPLNLGRLPTQRSRNSSSRNARNAPSSRTDTSSTTASTGATTTPATQQPAVQLSQLQDILSQMAVPKPEPKEAIDLSEAITPETMIPILADPQVQERLKPFLPEGETLKSTEEELRETVHSPSFRQAMATFSSALASGQLAPLLAQFGLPEGAQTAASKGDVEAFARAMQEETKKNENKDENMSID